MNWRHQSVETLQSELDQLVQRIEPRLPTVEDYKLPRDRKAALREVESLLASALNPNEHVDRANLLYLKAHLLNQLGRRLDAKHVTWGSAALEAFFESKDQALWLEVRWHRIKLLGEQQRWLAFERALSELIGYILPSRSEDYDLDLSAARHARGLCYQLRGLTCDDPETTDALLAAGLGDLEKVTAGEAVESAIAAAKERLDQWQQDPGQAKMIEPSFMPNTIGLLRFTDWPRHQRLRFLSGANRSTHARFFAEKSPGGGMIFMLVLFLFFAFTFAIGFGEIFARLLSILRIVAYIPAVWMVICTVQIGRDLYTYWQQKKTGAIVYGFLIDAEKLAVRSVAAFSDSTYFWGENSVLIPLEQIHGSSIGQRATYATSGRMRHADTLVVSYRDAQNKSRTVSIPDRFNLSVRKIHDLFQVLKHDLVGTWQEDKTDRKIQFNQDSGTATDYGSETFHFRWREIEGGAIEAIALPGSTEGFESGIYHFVLTAQGSSFELEFLEGFGGRYLKDFKRTSEHTEMGMQSGRAAMRLAASKPLPEMSP